MTTRPPLSIKLSEWSKLWKSMPSTLATWSKKELLETLEGGDGEGGGEVAVECWCWRADMIGPTERGRNPGDPEHMGSSKNWNGKYIFQLICGIERFSHTKSCTDFVENRGKKDILRFALCLLLMQDQTNINCTKGKLIEISLVYPKKIMTPWYFMLHLHFKYLLLSIKISNAPNCDPRELHLLESLKISNRYKCAPAKRHRRHIKNMYLSNIFQAFPFLSFACLSESLKSKKEWSEKGQFNHMLKRI